MELLSLKGETNFAFQASADNEPSKAYKPQRTAVVTGRDGKLSDVINVFNAPQPVEEKPAPVSSTTSSLFEISNKLFPF